MVLLLLLLLLEENKLKVAVGVKLKVWAGWMQDYSENKEEGEVRMPTRVGPKAEAS